MKSRNTMTFKDVQDYYFKEATHLAATSVCVMLIAMNQELGIGKKRAERIVERYRRINMQLNDYDDDTRSDAEIRTRMQEIGLQEFADQMMGMHTLKQYGQEKKIRNSVSIAESAQAQKNLKLMQELMNR